MGGGGPAHRRPRHRHRHHRGGAGGGLDLRHQPADGAGPAQRRRRRRRPQVSQGPARPPPAEDRAAAFASTVLRDTEQVWGQVFQAAGGTLPRAAPGAVPRRHAHRLRHRAVGDGAVLLPGRRQGLHRPRLLRHAGAPHGRAGRLRAGLRDRARGRPPRAEPDGHHRQGRRAARARLAGADERAVGARGTAGRLPGRRVGAPLAEGQGLARAAATSKRP